MFIKKIFILKREMEFLKIQYGAIKKCKSSKVA